MTKKSQPAMIREMKFDVATPAHNEEKTIGQCLSSILTELEGKSYDVEIIVVNNASTDGTRILNGSCSP